MLLRISAIATAAALAVFIAAYVIRPQFERTSVALPKFCVPSTSRAGETTVSLADDGRSAVTATVDTSRTPFPSIVYLVAKSPRRVLWGSRFSNDILSAAIDHGILYIYNDKIAEWLDARTGRQLPVLFTIDNFGGLSSKDRPVLPEAPTGRWYMETTAIISRWNRNGSVDLYRRITFNGIAFNCFINGANGGVKALW